MKTDETIVALPDPPPHLIGGIGSGDFWQIGNEIVGLTMATARLDPADRILDVGCGLGNGRLFASFFVLDEQSRKLAEAGTTDPRFTERIEEGMIGDAANPDAAVAFDAEWLATMVASAGLVFDAFYPGRWRHLAVMSHQDILIAHKP